MRFKVTGKDRVKKALIKKGTRYAIGYQRGVFRAGLWLQRESQKIVPVDSGVLRDSARPIPSGTGFDTEVRVTYNTHYAVYVHEDLNARHKPGKTAKYLEIPARTGRKKMSQIFRESLEQAS